jgi:hypothetical protein
MSASHYASTPNRRDAPDRAPAPSPAPKRERERNTVRILQTHDAAGAPAPAEYVRVIHHNSINTLASDAMEFLAPLNPTQTEHRGFFRYTDPKNGSGRFRLEHFARSDAARIQELVRLEEISRVVGKQPFRAADVAFGRSMTLRSNNPWVMFPVATLSVFFGCVLLVMIVVAGANTVETVMLVIVGVALIGAGVFLAVQNVARLRWWRKARRYVRTQGGPMPSDLTGF